MKISSSQSSTEIPRLIPAGRTRVEIRVSNSRFITTAVPVFTIESAKDFIKSVRAEFDDASHNVPVYIVGHGAAVTSHCSDDREPSGTAGRPALAVLQGSGLGDVALVVTRYFGGTKLGTGGLVRAYSDAVREVLKHMPLAHKITCHTALLSVPYALYERTKLMLEKHPAAIQEEDFATEVTFTVSLPASGFDELQENLQILTNGQVQAEVIIAYHDAIIPLK